MGCVTTRGCALPSEHLAIGSQMWGRGAGPPGPGPRARNLGSKGILRGLNWPCRRGEISAYPFHQPSVHGFRVGEMDRGFKIHLFPFSPFHLFHQKPLTHNEPMPPEITPPRNKPIPLKLPHFHIFTFFTFSPLSPFHLFTFSTMGKCDDLQHLSLMKGVEGRGMQNLPFHLFTFP